MPCPSLFLAKNGCSLFPCTPKAGPPEYLQEGWSMSGMKTSTVSYTGQKEITDFIICVPTDMTMTYF